MGLLLGKALAFLGSKLGAYVVMGGLAAAIAAFAWYVWTDREALQIENAGLRATNQQWESVVDRVRENGERRVMAEQATTRAVAATLERRNHDLAGLSARLADVAAVEIPDAEAACPVPAPIRRAVELLPEPVD